MDSISVNITEKEKVELIEIKIKKISQLFNSLDPSPFIEKDLDDDAFEYIVSSVKEHHMKTKAKLIIHLPKIKHGKVPEEGIRTAIRNFFEYKEKLSDKNIKLKFEEGRKSLFIGLSFLCSCLILREWIALNFTSIFSSIIAEGLIIGGWVAMWKPISELLYEWWPLKKDKKIYHKISKMPIEFKYS